MKIKRVVEEEIGLPEGVNLEQLTIQNELYDLIVKNKGERLELQFYKRGEGKLNEASPEFAIRVHEDGIFFERYLHRPKHDHDDLESLQTTGDDNNLIWSKESPYRPGKKDKIFRIRFGSKTVNY